jgi:Ca2+-binding EF-hand superfamily protein
VDGVDMVRAALQGSHVSLQQLKDTFQYYDRQNNGRVRYDDIGTVFEEVKVPLKRRELQSITDAFAVGETGWVQYVPLLKALETRLSVQPKSLRHSTSGLSEDLASKVSSLLESLILKGCDFRSEFDHLDSKGYGAVIQSDFKELMTLRYHGDFSRQELDILEKYYAHDSDPRKIHYVKMLFDLHPHHVHGDLQLRLTIEENLRQKIRRKCDYLSPGELRRPFKHFARRKPDYGFSLEELSVGLKDLGIKLATDQEISLFDLINTENYPAVTYNSFVTFVCDPHHRDVIWKLRKQIAKSKISNDELIVSLTRQDTNASGLLTPKQVLKVLNSFHIELSESDISRLMFRFDDEDTQRFNIDKFSSFLENKTSGQPGDDDARNRSVRLSSGTSEVSADRLTSKLQSKVSDLLDSGKTKADVFYIFDRDQKGTIDLVSLQQGARELSINLSRPEARALLRRMSLSAGGLVDKQSFFVAIGIKDSNRETAKHRRGVAGDSDSDRLDKQQWLEQEFTKRVGLLAGLVSSVSKLVADGKYLEKLLSEFKIDDLNNGGQLSSSEFLR